jgi:chromosome segregation ATPase
MQLSQAQSRIRELETALAEQSKDETGRVSSLKERERELSAELDRTKVEAASLKQELVSAETELANTRTELAATKSSLTEAQAAAAAAISAGDDGAKQRIASLTVELNDERTKRVDAEEQLNKLREETSAGPYESANAAALQEARTEIDRLQRELSNERQARADLESRFAALTVQLEQQAAAPPPPTDNAEMRALQEDQNRLMAAIQQDLEASKRREEELRATIATLQSAEGEGGGSGALVDEVNDLEAENRALQASLDAEHERNVELAAKLEVATRVADLIFKMRSEGRVPSVEAVEEAAGQ